MAELLMIQHFTGPSSGRISVDFSDMGYQTIPHLERTYANRRHSLCFQTPATVGHWGKHRCQISDFSTAPV